MTRNHNSENVALTMECIQERVHSRECIQERVHSRESAFMRERIHAGG